MCVSVCPPPRAVSSAEVARRVGAKLPEFNGTWGGEGGAQGEPPTGRGLHIPEFGCLPALAGTPPPRVPHCVPVPPPPGCER